MSVRWGATQIYGLLHHSQEISRKCLENGAFLPGAFPDFLQRHTAMFGERRRPGNLRHIKQKVLRLTLIKRWLKIMDGIKATTPAMPIKTQWERDSPCDCDVLCSIIFKFLFVVSGYSTNISRGWGAFPCAPAPLRGYGPGFPRHMSEKVCDYRYIHVHVIPRNTSLLTRSDIRPLG